MIITMQIQIDPLEPKSFSDEELAWFEGELNSMCSRLERKSGEFLRSQFCVDGEVRSYI